MATHSDQTNPATSSYRLGRRFFHRLWRLLKPYWFRRGAIWSWLALIVILTAIVIDVSLGAWASFILKHQTNALLARQTPLFWSLLWMQVGVLAYKVLNTMGQATIQARLNYHWRRWLTVHLVDQYLDRRTYYEISLDQTIDNPDQRIQEETNFFCNYMSTFPNQLVQTTATIATQSIIIATIAPNILIVMVGFAAFKVASLALMYTPTIRLNFEINKSEANLRFGLLHVRENAETVAFYRGEYAERQHIILRLATVINRQISLAMYAIGINGFIRGFDAVWSVLPVFLLAPMFFAHQLGYGSIAQAVFAGAQISLALTLFTSSIEALSKTAPRAIRLAEIQEKFEALALDRHPTAGRSQIRFSDGPEIRLRQVSIQTPGGEQNLVKDLDLGITAGEHMVIVGQTGVGKSSLLRAMAGLWARGGGTIQMPPVNQMLFLPQRPYMILADLRSQIVYPSGRKDITDAELQRALERVNLPNLAAHHGGLSAQKDWGKVLSLGEQQRLAFARALIARPKYIFLDEATSAVDAATEHLLYTLLAEIGATFISVSHRQTLLGHHRKALRLLPGGAWEVLAATDLTLTFDAAALS